jgi:murein DD-endopeptidase MepM/ murein hydrolase activator NlpD
MRWPLFVSLVTLCSCGVQYRATGGAQAPDTSFVYTLPFPKGTAHLLVQGYNSRLSHRGRLGLDFKMKKGSLVTAARDGMVTRVVDSFSKGGLKKKYLGRANMVVVRHADGSQVMYAHIKKGSALVRIGDSVRTGQSIARSGSVGYSAFPHLHFILWGPTPRGRVQLPTRFYTKKGPAYLRPGRWYRNR